MFQSMVEVLQTRASQTPDALAFSWLSDGLEEGSRLTYGELDRAARAIAVALRDVAGPGERALLVYAPGLEFIAGFFGCQYAGIVPVPAYPPRLDRLAQGWQLLATLAADCEPRLLLTGGPAAGFVAGSAGLIGDQARLTSVVTDTVDLAWAQQWREPPTDLDALALLQYTSGSTANPKGVKITHRSLMHNEVMIQAAFEHSGEGGGVSWLPPYHDMGLIGGLLQVVFHGAWCRLMSPVVFLQDPFRWLASISRYRADTSGGPNFAYDFCVQRITPEQRATLDLSNWSVAAIGSEPISAATMAQFTATFAPHGFRGEAFFPCYGLAEATLLVTSSTKDKPPVLRSFRADLLEEGRAVATTPGESARSIVSCGRPWLDQEICICAPETRLRRPDGEVGEIWLKGPSVAQGYWNRPDDTAYTFQAYRADTGDGPYLRTGDLGFLLDGELYITGRIKDLLIIRGRNHYPQDIEETVQAVHPGLRKGAGAVFEDTRQGRPGVIVVQEVERRSRDLDGGSVRADIRQAVAERHEVQVHDVQLVEAGSIPKTSSGKVRRQACRTEYAQGTLRIWKGTRS